MDWKDFLKDYKEIRFYPDPGDKFHPDTVAEILASESPDSELIMKVLEIYESNVDTVRYEIRQAAEHKLGRGLTGEEAEDLDDAIDQYVLFVYPFDHYKDQQYCVNLFLDTGDGNYDFSLNAAHVPHWNGSQEPYQKEASILWLSRRQGCQDKQLYAVLNGEQKLGVDTFLGSLYQDIENATSSMLAVTFFVSMTLGQLMALNSAMRMKDGIPRSITLSKQVNAGLYDPWYGAGGVLELVFDRDIEIPLDKLRGPVVPDGKDGYSVANCYGICESLWKKDMVRFDI